MAANLAGLFLVVKKKFKGRIKKLEVPFFSSI